MRNRYELILVPLASDIPEVVRLRQILKTVLRSQGFRCKSIKRIDVEAKEKKNVGQVAHRPGAAATALKLIESRRRVVAPRTSKKRAA